MRLRPPGVRVRTPRTRPRHGQDVRIIPSTYPEIYEIVANPGATGGWARDLYYLDCKMSPSTRLTAQVNARSLVDGVQADVESLVPALEALLYPTGVPAGVDLGAVVQAFGRLLERDLAELTACERVLQAAQAQDLGALRAEAAESLRAALLRVRTLLMAAFGPRAVSACALSGPLPDAAEQLVAYARAVARALEQAAPAYTEPAPFATMDLAGAAGFLRRHVDELEILLHAGDARMCEATATRHERIAADCEHHLQAIRLVVDALVWLVYRDPGRTHRRAVTEELPALPGGKAAALGA